MRWYVPLVVAMLSIAQAAQAAPYLYDLGTARSAVWEGCTAATPESAYSEQAGFGWESPQGLKPFARAYQELVENRSRGTNEPPPMWTNPMTEDGVVGDRENAFLMRVPPGEYDVYVLCGTSESYRAQLFDFTVQVGAQAQRVQIEGGYQYRSLHFRATAGAGPLAVRFTPRSKWVAAAILAWAPADAARVEKEVIAPLEASTYNLPPEEWAKWKEDPEPDPGPMPALTPTEDGRGFVLYARHYLECIYPRTRPRTEEKDPEARLFASPGEYEPFTFSVYPLKDLAGARVSVSDIGPVPASAIDVRRVVFTRARPNYRVDYRWHWVPDALEHFDTLALKAGENARFWLTLHVPEGARPGTYTGKVTFTCAGGKAEVPVRLRILPIRLLEDPSRLYAIYYRHPYDQMAAAEDDVSREHFRREAELEHQDMLAHGTRNVVLSASSPAADAQGNFRFNWDLLAEKLALWQKYGFRGPIVMGVNSGSIYAKYMKESPGSHLRGVKDPPEAFSTELTAMVAAIEAERKRRGWPEFLYYPVDEPGTDAASIAYMIKVLKAVRAAGVRTYITADPTHEQFAPLRPYVDVWCTQPFAPDRETVQADMKARKVEYWCYPNHVNGENDHTPVAGARMTYGFGFWRSGFLTLIPWIYSSSSGDPRNYLDGSAMDFFNRHEPDGTPIPVAMWEAYREGYDDYRYVYTLTQAIAAAKKSAKPAARAAAAAEKELQSVWDAIRVQAKYKDTGLWAPADFDAYRWVVARQILAVQDAAR